PSVVSKLSLATGLVYSYTKDPGPGTIDAWYLTAISFQTGATVWKRLDGTGFGYNNNFAPVSLGPDGTPDVGVLGASTAIRDAACPSYRVRPIGSAWLRAFPTALPIAPAHAVEMRPRAAARRAILADRSSCFIAARTLLLAFRSLRAL